MKNVICRLESLSPFDLRGTAEHLSAMAEKGWHLEHVGKCFWRYRRADPARVHYAVTCPPAAGEDGDLGDRLFFQELCAAAGWEAVTDWAKLQIYASEQENPTPLETDGALLLDRVHSSMRRTYLRDCWFTAGALILLLLLLLYTMLSQPRSFFLSSVELLVTAICPLFLLGTLWAAGIYYRWRRRSLRSVEEGGPLAAVPRSYRFLKYLSRVLLLLLALTLASIVLSPESSEDSFHLALILLLNLLISALLFPLLGWLERKGMSLGYRFLSAFLALLVILLCLGYCAPRLSLRANSPPPPSYTWDDREWDAEPQSLPLTVEDLTGKPWDHVRRNTYPDGRSPLTAQTAYGERAAREDGTEAYLYYSVLDAREGFVCRTIRAGLLDVSPAHAYSPEDPAPWGAEAVYRHFWNDGAVNTWLLVWPGRVARVHTEDTPEAEQKALIAARLAPEDWKEETT